MTQTIPESHKNGDFDHSVNANNYGERAWTGESLAKILSLSIHGQAEVGDPNWVTTFCKILLFSDDGWC